MKRRVNARDLGRLRKLARVLSNLRIGAPNDPAVYKDLAPLSKRPRDVARLLDAERGER